MYNYSNFGNLPQEYCSFEESMIAVVPVGYDQTSTWIKGADKGPLAILDASANLELYDIETDSQVYTKGIFTDEPVNTGESPEQMYEDVRKVVAGHIKHGKFTVVLGGEHSVSIGSVKAHADFYDDLTVLQLDAHADLRVEYEGSKYNHACVMARVHDYCPFVQAGIRSMSIEENDLMDRSRVFFAKDIYNDPNWVEKLIPLLTSNVYITIDLDVFDPSVVPSTGTPEPGGLQWYDVMKLMKAVGSQKNIVGFDVVELCPNEADRGPDFLAAKLIYKILSYKFEGACNE